MTSATQQLDSPDPHDPRPSKEPTLLVLEGRLLREFGLAVTRPDRARELDVALQEYVDYLRILGCPPEHVVLHIKRRLDATTALSAVGGKVAEREQREAIVRRTIELYFGAV